mmetsp:Transcript_6926/g.10964  ORF Transcript_6926/g.10964 Transcript_6926/m.10964 type:complete len:237 (-) Transcript_6926:167-877(-)
MTVIVVCKSDRSVCRSAASSAAPIKSPSLPSPTTPIRGCFFLVNISGNCSSILQAAASGSINTATVSGIDMSTLYRFLKGSDINSAKHPLRLKIPRHLRCMQWLRFATPPEQHISHVLLPQSTLISPTTRSPTFHCEPWSLPSSYISPTNSWPMTMPAWSPLYPFSISRSVPQTPAKLTRITHQLASRHVGLSMSSRNEIPPLPSTTAPFIPVPHRSLIRPNTPPLSQVARTRFAQ